MGFASRPATRVPGRHGAVALTVTLTMTLTLT